MGKLHYFTLLLIVILIAIASGGLLESLSKKPIIQREEPGKTADYFVEKFTIRTLDRNGQLTHSIRGDRLMHYPHDQSVEIDKPQISVFAKKQKLAFSATADKGTYFRTDNRMDLHSNIVLQKLSTGAAPLEMTASSLSIFPEQQKLISTEKVTVRQGKHVIESTGLDARMDKGTIHFLSRVKSRYVLADK